MSQVDLMKTSRQNPKRGCAFKTFHTLQITNRPAAPENYEQGG
jgi:hypothetical protein